MAEYTADFEAGVNGNAITTGAGEASATAWNAIADTPIYDNTHVAHGSLAAKFPGSVQNESLTWNTTPETDSYFRFYAYFTAFSTSGAWIFTSNGGPDIEITSAGKIRGRDNTGSIKFTFTNSIALNQWIRIECNVNLSSTYYEVRLFNSAESSTPTETQSSATNTWGAFNSFCGGTRSDLGYAAWGSAFWLDSIVANATSYPGPALEAQIGLPTADSVDGAWTDQADGTSLYAALAAASDTEYIKSELAPSTSATRVKLDPALIDPLSSDGHILHWRPGKDAAGGDTVNMTVSLRQGGGNSLGGGTLIADFTRSNVSTFTTYDETLSAGEADTITDYGDLYLEFEADTA